MKLGGIIYDSLTNGNGIRHVIFFGGCPHKCDDCHNKHLWNKADVDDVEINYVKNKIKENMVDFSSGITLSGGEPFVNISDALELAMFTHSLNKNVWCYTGYNIEQIIKQSLYESDIDVYSKSIFDINKELLEKSSRYRLLREIDVLVDGKFIKSLADVNLKFKGSSNQRIIDIAKNIYRYLKNTISIYKKELYQHELSMEKAFI